MVSEDDLLDLDALESLLRWYADMGIDVALDETPKNRFIEKRREAARGSDLKEMPLSAPPGHGERPPRTESLIPRFEPASPRGAKTPALPASANAVVQSAAEAAQSAMTLDELRERLAAYDGCALRDTATQLVFSDGNPQARVMIVGEAPGADEDRIGRPFVGRAGQLLDKMLAAIGLDRTSVYIANIVPWRPPGNRTPTPLEAASCLPFLKRQIELVDPDILICLGAPSAQTLLGIKEGIMKARGRWMSYEVGARKIPAIALLHPAYLLRTPAQKKLAWQDLRLIAKEIEKRELEKASPN